jgi:hypothetical protein
MAKLMKKAQDGMALQRKKDERERMKVRKDTTSSPSKEVKKSMAEGAMEAKSAPKKKMGGAIKKAQMGIKLTKPRKGEPSVKDMYETYQNSKLAPKPLPKPTKIAVKSKAKNGSIITKKK